MSDKKIDNDSRWAMEFITPFAISRGWVLEDHLPNQVVDILETFINLRDMEKAGELPDEMVAPFNSIRVALGRMSQASGAEKQTPEQDIERANAVIGYTCVGD